MILELILIGSATAHWRKQRYKETDLAEMPKKKTVSIQEKFNPKKLVEHIKYVFTNDECQPVVAKQADTDKAIVSENPFLQSNTLVAAGNFVMALLGGISPLFILMAVVGILYVSRSMLLLALQDLKNRRYMSIFVVESVLFIGMILTGHLILATFSSLFGDSIVKLINKTEESANKQLVNVFGKHPEKVWLKKDGLEIQVDFDSIQAGDTVVVSAGEMIPVDGQVMEGLATVDQHILTGESQPVEKMNGDKVFAATLVISGRIHILVETAGQNTVAAKIGDILNNTKQYKDKLMARGQEITESLLPLQLSVFAFTLLLLGKTSALTVLWTGLGTTMVMLGPITVLNYLRVFSRNGILIKDGRVLESLHQVDTIVFDKTGTLTMEQPEVGAIHCLSGWEEEEVLLCAAAAERRQSHPVAKAILSKAAAFDIGLPDLDSAHYEMGYGIKVLVKGKRVQVGSARFMQRENIALPEQVLDIQEQAEDEGYSLIYVGIDGELAGILEMRPCIRPEAATVVRHLKERGMKLYIISGDHEHPTKKMAEQLGMDHYFAEVLPERKAELVKTLAEKGRFVCFIGDGINDSIALKSAQVSVSIQGASTAATNTAQIIFMDGTLNHLQQLFLFSDEFEKTMKVNFYTSVVPGVLCFGGVYFLHIGLTAGMGLFYAGTAAGLFNTFVPVLKYKDKELAGKCGRTLLEDQTATN
ncbi:Heavy metal translocating P-type ATPase [Candidatus Electronema halotolerans]